nr:AsmA-like C-terminal domain-containing protein [Desulfobulbaceae bacterium]
MRKRTALLLLLVIALTALYFTPKLLNQKHFQDRITRDLITTYGLDCRFAAIRWHWLPFPALYIEHFESKSDLFTLEVPLIQLTPRLKFIFDDKGQLGRIKLIKPVLHFKHLPTADNIRSKSAIPDLNFAISEGSITLPRIDTIGGTNISLQPLEITDFNLKIKSTSNRLKFNGNFQSSFSDKIEAIGRIDLNKKYYRLDLSANETNIAPLFNQADKNYQINDSRISLRMHCEGLGKDNFKLNFSEINTPFSLTAYGESYKIRSIGNVAFTKLANEFFFEFDRFDFEDPAASFSGKVSKRNNSLQKEPEWTLDISGNDIDLASVRTRILSLWPENETATTTCSVVRGGFAKTARYIFKGPTTDFEYLDKMKIWAEAVDVPLYISDIGLAIDRASGPISIINGYLAGKNLMADIGSTHGKKASLWLDLIEQDDAFYLDINLDADLQDLQDVLGIIIEDDAFQNELCQFSEISGRAKGNLTLGNTLGNVETTVQISYLSAAGFYDRLPWPFKLDGRKLDILPDKVVWDDFQAQVGGQTIKKTSGSVEWANEISIQVTELDATANLETLFDQSFLQVNTGKAYLKNALHEVITAITGVADFSNTQFSGPALYPEKWKFETAFVLNNTTIHSPYLPPAIVSEIVQGTLSSKQVRFSGIFNSFDQNLFMSGTYSHTLLDNWHGRIDLNGIVKPKLGQWLRSTGWIPDEFFPRLPLTLNNFQIANTAPSFDSFHLNGEIIAQINQSDTKSMLIDISKQKNISLSSLNFNDGVMQGKITYLDQSKSGRSLLTWQGGITMKTLDSFFEKNIFKEGQINGVFSQLSTKKPTKDTTYAGYLEINDLSWNYLPDTPPLIARNIRLNGEGNTIQLKQFTSEIEGDTLDAKGQITHSTDKFLLDISLHSENLTFNKIKTAFDLHKEFIKKNLQPTNSNGLLSQEEHTDFIDQLSGKLDFDFFRLNYIKQPADTESLPSQPPHVYTWKNPYGTISFDSGDIKLQFFPSDLCGMKMSATYYNGDNESKSFFDFISGTDEINFEEFLPCMGQQKSIIKGPFKIKGHIEGFPGNWNTGDLSLTSEGGIIKKMNILSNIFSVINFTELFAWGEPPDIDGKGLMYSDLVLKSYIDKNTLVLERAVLKGKGVNLTGRGSIDLADNEFNTDLTFFVAPFKMIDNVITNVPLVGKAIGGEKESIFTFPVGVSGPLANPETTALQPSAVGSAAVEFILDTLTLPFRIFIPDLTKNKRPIPIDAEPINE